MFKRNGVGNYQYTAARVKAKKSKLLKADDYNKILLMSVPEISRYISEAGYSKEMTDLATTYSGLRLVEYATYENMAKAFRGVLGAASGDCKNQVGAYLRKWDFMNLLTVIRGKRYGLSAVEIRADFVPAGQLNSEDLEKLIQCSTVDEVISTFSSLSHLRIPDNVLDAYKSQDILAPLEDYFVADYYRELLATVKGNDRPTTVFRSYIRSSIDVKNIETLLKLKSEKVGAETVMKYFIPGGREIDERLMTQFAEASDIASLLNDLQQLKMFADIKEGLSADMQVTDIVNALAHYQGELAQSVSSKYPLSVLPVVDYMIRKEAEVKNIRLIAYGTSAGLDEAMVKGLLVI